MKAFKETNPSQNVLTNSRITSSLSVPLSNILNTTSNNSKKTFGQKPLIEKVIEIKKKTTMTQNSCELINANLGQINGNIGCLMKTLEK